MRCEVGKENARQDGVETRNYHVTVNCGDGIKSYPGISEASKSNNQIASKYGKQCPTCSFANVSSYHTKHILLVADQGQGLTLNSTPCTSRR